MDDPNDYLRIHSEGPLRKFERKDQSVVLHYLWSVIVTNAKNGKYLITDYTMGCGHIDARCKTPSYWKLKDGVPIPIWPWGTTDDDELAYTKARPTKPELADVVYSLFVDAESIRDTTLSEFCEEFGYQGLEGLEVYRTFERNAAQLRELFGKDYKTARECYAE